MSETEEFIKNKLNNYVTNNSLKTLCIYDSNPVGIIEDLVEVNGIYELNDKLPVLICGQIIDYVQFEDKQIDILNKFDCKKIAYFYQKEEVNKKYKKQTSQKQEKRIAKKFNGKVTPGSGAFGFNKGDIKTTLYLIEAKYTNSSEYRLTLATWNKIKNEAYSVDKVPLMEICLDQSNEPRNLIIIEPIYLLALLKITESKFVEQYYSLGLNNKENSKSVLIKKNIVNAHIENVCYNIPGKNPSFLFKLNNITLIMLTTEEFLRINSL